MTIGEHCVIGILQVLAIAAVGQDAKYARPFAINVLANLYLAAA